MNKETNWDWGYIGKVAGSCAAALTLATGLAMFTSSKTAKAESLETKLDTRKVARELARPDIRQIVREPAESTDVIGTMDFIMPEYDDEEWKLDNLLIPSAQRIYETGNYQMIDEYKDGELGCIEIEDKRYSFWAVDGRITGLSRLKKYDKK